MTTKTKSAKSNRGRPKKDFSIVAKSIQDKTNTDVRWRGRPKKEKKDNQSLNTKIFQHNKDINSISKKNEKIHLDITNTSFVNKKIEKKWNQKSDNIALWLLIFSMILFIFSLYKTFYHNDNIDQNIDLSKNIENEQINDEIKIETNNDLIKDSLMNDELIETNANQEKNTNIETVKTKDYEIISIFYHEINDKNFAQINSLVDSYLISSNVFKTYYSSNWLSRFTSMLANKKVYLTNIKQIKLDESRSNVKHYSYTLKYKLNNSNELFQEEREASIVTRWDQDLIWSLRCITTWCSKMPFFNLPKYEK